MRKRDQSDNPAKSSKSTAPEDCTALQKIDSQICANFLVRLGFAPSEVAILIRGWSITSMECFSEKSHKLFLEYNQLSKQQKESEDKFEKMVLQLKMDCTYALLLHSVDEDMTQWKR